MTGMIEQREMRPGYRNPPHSREAEESVIGAVLLSVDAVNEVMDQIHPEDFYVPAHQAIFEGMRELFDSNQAIDAVTVSEVLRRRGELEKVGGVQYLARLVDIVPSTSNISYYAGIVEEHAKRRELIRAGAAVTDVAFDIDEEIAIVLDRAEQAVLGVAEKRSSQTLAEVGPMLSDVLEQIELMEQRGSELTGLATGYVDLDRKLAGLQPANLVVVASRPGMGKSSLALGIAINVASMDEPVAIFSLELSKDYLQLMESPNRENRQQEISEITRNLKNLARELGVPIIALSQLNRSLEQREDKRPRLSDLRESGAIEQDADVVMFIYRHEYYHPEDQEKRGIAEVIIAKHRAGSTGPVEMTFQPEFTRFANLGRDVS